MTLPRFGGQFACFSAKDIYKVWRGRGLYSGCLCGKVYSINLYTANHRKHEIRFMLLLSSVFDALREKEFEHGLFL